MIAGGSSDTDSFMKELKELAKDDSRIIFTGFVQGKMLDELYSNAYIYTLPSDLEGMPLSLLEAIQSDVLNVDCAMRCVQFKILFPVMSWSENPMSSERRTVMCWSIVHLGDLLLR